MASEQESRIVAASAVMTRRLSLHWIVPAAVAVAALLLFGPDLLLWWRVWRDPDSFYAHGPVVPVLAGLLVWIDWKRLTNLEARPSLWGLVLVIPALVLVTLSRWTYVYFLAEIGWLLFVPGAVWLLHGRRMMRALLGPITLMFFCLPMPAEVIEPISLPIQEYSTAWATRYLTCAMLPAVREKTLILLPHYTMDVGIQCSGYKLLVGLMMFATFLAAAHQGIWWRKALLVLGCIPLATIVNASRIAFNGVVGEKIGYQAGLTFHDNAGIFVWSMSFLSLYLGMTLLKCNKLKGTESS
jgi:exosortase